MDLYVLKNGDFVIKATGSGRGVSKNDEMSIKNEELCIKNDEFCRLLQARGGDVRFEYTNEDSATENEDSSLDKMLILNLDQVP